ncbi:caspase-9 isoform X2 [Accipiter gentilis]|uniref:caspase-9 isoform X2 n=1 Tax=Astur gentilis TaxID=8957 RepID=UPI00211014F6|nr:caspase-9 isoform X2 [Accipiter gentilis]
MEEAQRRALRRGRARLVAELRVAPLWDPLEDRGLFTRPMVEELQSAGSRGEQARQLVIDLETRGKWAFPVFLSILRDTGQGDLADMLIEECECPPAPPQLVDLRPVELDLREEKHRKNVSFPERLSIPVQAESERPQMPPVPAQGSAVDKRNCDLVYELKADPCGHCLIINNVNFSRESDLLTRDGSDVDCRKLEKRFKALRFNVLTQRNLEAKAMVSELRKLARQDHRALDCCVVVILSHGCQVLSPGGRHREARGTWKHWTVCWSNTPIRNTCSTCYCGWQIPSLPRGSTSRCRAVSTSSVKNSSSPANDVQAPRSPPSARVTSPLPDDIHACCDSASMLPVAFVRLSVEMFVLRNVISECFPCCAMERSRRLVPC